MIPYADVSGMAIWPAGMLSVLFPIFEGMGQGEIWSPYIGVLPFMFALIGIVKCWSHMWVRYLTGLSLAAMLYALGGISAIHGLLYALVPWPFWSSLRQLLTRVIIGCCIALSFALLLSKPSTYWIFFTVLLILGSCGLLRFEFGNGKTGTEWRVLLVALVSSI
jgi:hypothetical protein